MVLDTQIERLQGRAHDHSRGVRHRHSHAPGIQQEPPEKRRIAASVNEQVPVSETRICTVALLWRLFLVPSPPTAQTRGEAQWPYDTFTFLRCLLLSKRRCTRLTWGAGAWP